MSSDRELRGKLREEIIESEKMQSDFFKWKLIGVAAIASVSLGFAETTKPTSYGVRWLLCLIPLLCAYVDLICIHFELRIITIGAYLRSTGDAYETVMFTLRDQAGKSPFNFEKVALHLSSIVFNLTLVGVGFVMLAWTTASEVQHEAAYIIMGFLGTVFSVFLFLTERGRWDRIRNSIDAAASEASSRAADSAFQAATQANQAAARAASAANAAANAAAPGSGAAAIAAAASAAAAAEVALAAAAAASAAATTARAGTPPGWSNEAAARAVAAAQAAEAAAARVAEVFGATVAAAPVFGAGSPASNAAAATADAMFAAALAAAVAAKVAR
jgi:hypothetical protein